MQIIRAIVLITGFFFLLSGVTFLWGMTQFPVFWLNSYLIGATLMAFAVPTLWIGATQTYKALVGGGLSIVIAAGGIAIYLLRLSPKMPEVLLVGEYALYLAVLSIWLVFLGLKVSSRKTERFPLSMQWLFSIVMTVMLFEGIYLVIPIPGHFPWLLTSELSVFYGWILIGGSIFFGWSLLQPIWENGYPLLYALIIYDALMIGPFLSVFKKDQIVSPFYLWLALIVTVGSGIWAITELILRFSSRKKA